MKRKEIILPENLITIPESKLPKQPSFEEQIHVALEKFQRSQKDVDFYKQKMAIITQKLIQFITLTKDRVDSNGSLNEDKSPNELVGFLAFQEEHRKCDQLLGEAERKLRIAKRNLEKISDKLQEMFEELMEFRLDKEDVSFIQKLSKISQNELAADYESKAPKIIPNLFIFNKQLKRLKQLAVFQGEDSSLNQEIYSAMVTCDSVFKMIDQLKSNKKSNNKDIDRISKIGASKVKHELALDKRNKTHSQKKVEHAKGWADFQSNPGKYQITLQGEKENKEICMNQLTLSDIYLIYDSSFEKLTKDDKNKLINRHLSFLINLGHSARLTPTILDDFVERVYPLLDRENKAKFINELVLKIENNPLDKFFDKAKIQPKDRLSACKEMQNKLLEKLSKIKSQNSNIFQKISYNFDRLNNYGKIAYRILGVLTFGLALLPLARTPNYAAYRNANDLAFDSLGTDKRVSIGKIKKGAKERGEGLQKEMELMFSSRKKTSPISKKISTVRSQASRVSEMKTLRSQPDKVPEMKKPTKEEFIQKTKEKYLEKIRTQHKKDRRADKGAIANIAKAYPSLPYDHFRLLCRGQRNFNKAVVDNAKAKEAPAPAIGSR